MKRPIFFILLFLILPILGEVRFSDVCMANETCEMNVILDENTGKTDVLKIENNSKFSDKYNMGELISKLENMGFSSREIVSYLDPNITNKLDKIIEGVEKEEENSYVDVKSGYPKIVVEQIGVKIIEDDMIEQIVANLKNRKSDVLKLTIEEVVPQYTSKITKDLTNLKSKFTTYIYGVNQEGRIQNIIQASSKFNGKILLPGEKLSFNELIGETTKENGYALAKVILNGKYTEDYGGGVCQVASTLYNSALLAGLEINRVAPHSLKVGYVAGSFDAMVSAGVSDLIIRNPLDTPVYIHAYATDTECGFKIFGEKNEYDIVRRTEILEIEEDEAEKIAFKSEGYLDFYKDGELVESKLIRKDKYKKPI